MGTNPEREPCDRCELEPHATKRKDARGENVIAKQMHLPQDGRQIGVPGHQYDIVDRTCRNHCHALSRNANIGLLFLMTNREKATV